MEKKTDESLEYSKAFEELQQIVAHIESGEISIDELADKVKRASFLIKICKAKLTMTEQEVNQILKEMEISNDK